MKRATTLEDVRRWRDGFPEGSWAREAIDLLFSEIAAATTCRSCGGELSSYCKSICGGKRPGQ